MTEVTSPSSLLAVDDALEIIAAHVTPLAPQAVALEDACGRFLSTELRAPLDLPPFANSAMDGYATRSTDTPGRLRVVGESAAGAPYPVTLGPGEAIRISTGAALPPGADTVAPIETVTVRGGAVELTEPVVPGTFVRDRGSDIRQGDLLLTAHTRLGPAQIGAAAACGLRTLPCRRRPRVAILTTGDELRTPGQTLRPGEIYDANRPMLRAALRLAGAEVTLIPAAADTLQAHTDALAGALEHDVVITSGGVSVGDHDIVRRAAAQLGVRELFWRIALRPGKPLSVGVRGDTLVFALPGNPVSTLVCFTLFVAPALLAMQGAADCRPAFAAGILATDVARNPVRDDLIRVATVITARSGDRPGGVPVLEPLPGQQSHQIAVTAQADGLARIPAGTGVLPAGSEVAYLPLGAHAYGQG